MNREEKVFIDGSFGEGGGQILRTSLALSCITGKALRIENIRAKRRNPGLAKQHISCINAACQISNGDCDGAKESSQTLDFKPGIVRAGKFSFDIGSAGSVSLVAQTILPALFLAERISTVTITGGTHNPLAPPFDFLSESFFPAIADADFYGKCILNKYGFFPAGGGSITFEVRPRQKDVLKHVNFTQPFVNLKISAKIYTARLGQQIYEKQKSLLLESRLAQTNSHFERLEGPLRAENIEHIDITDSNGPGNCVIIRISDETRTIIFSSFGMKGKPSHKVISEIGEQTGHFLESWAAIDSHLADQLLIYMAISGGGSFTTDKVMEHLSTNVHTIKKFIPVDFEISDNEGLSTVTCKTSSMR